MDLILKTSGILCSVGVFSLAALRFLGSRKKFVRDFSPFTNPDFFSGYKFAEKDIPDLTGRVIIVTGANSGLGYSTTKLLFEHGARVIMACRSMKKCEVAIEQILGTQKRSKTHKMSVPSAKNLIPIELDLSDLSTIENFARTFLKEYTELHHLVLNAGSFGQSFAMTKDGIEESFGTNHIGNFYLINLLIELMRTSSGEVKPTITFVSTMMHDFGLEKQMLEVIDTENRATKDLLKKLNEPSKFNANDSYSRSKLANVMYSNYLAREYPDILTNSVHPGGVLTPGFKKLTGGLPKGILKGISGCLLFEQDVAALTQVYAAVSKEVQENSLTGRYFVPIAREDNCAEFSKDEEAQDRLWKFSNEVLKLKGFH
eukprot:snap_masked-scaffold_34-processed-gene-1.56-mRNA-1 protein AED:0.88 eAED:0.88 QI:0/-1/0/1/-1/1/1/0/371